MHVSTVRPVNITLPLMLLLAIASFGQTKPSGTLIDEFGDTSCGDLLARIVYLGNRLDTHPPRVGIVFVFGSSDEVVEYPGAYIHRNLIGRRELNYNVNIFRIKNKEPGWRVQFWIAASESDVEKSDAQLIFSIPFTITSRFFLGSSTESPCSNFIHHGVAAVLKSDRTYLAQVVIYNIPPKERAETAASWLKEFKTEFGIDRRQLRIFFKRGPAKDFQKSDTDFWIVPSIHR